MRQPRSCGSWCSLDPNNPAQSWIAAMSMVMRYILGGCASHPRLVEAMKRAAPQGFQGLSKPKSVEYINYGRYIETSSDVFNVK
jgi:hypothetical protein